MSAVATLSTLVRARPRLARTFPRAPVSPAAPPLDRYRTELLQWQAARRSRGLPYDAWAVAALQQRHLGRTCPPERLTPSELARMFAAFAIIVPPAPAADTPAQLLARCFATCERRFNLAGENRFGDRDLQARYLDGAARNLFGRPAAALDVPSLRRLLSALESRAARVCATAFRAHATHLTRFTAPPLRRENLSPCCRTSIRHSPPPLNSLP